MADYNSLLIKTDPMGAFQEAKRNKQTNALYDYQLKQVQENVDDKAKTKNALAGYFDAPADQRMTQMQSVYQANPSAGTNLMQFQGGINSMQRDNEVRSLMAIKTAADPKAAILANHPEFVKQLAAHGHDVASATNEDILKDVDSLLAVNGHPQQQTIGDMNSPGKGLYQKDPVTGAIRQVTAPQKPETGSSDIQGFNLAQSQGFKGSFLDYQRQLAGAKDTKNDSTQLIQTIDPDTKESVWKLVDKNTGQTINPNVGNVAPKGSAGTGGREATAFNRVLMSASQATKSAENMMKLPSDADAGWFGSAKPGTSLLGSAKAVLANKASEQSTQSYKVFIAGITRALGGIEAAGLMPSGTLVHQMDAVIAQPGDTGITRLQKMAEIRQIMEEGVNTYLSNPRIAPEQKQQINRLIERMQKAIPFTQEDVLNLDQAQNPQTTINDVVKQRLLSEKNQAAPDASHPPAIQSLLDKYK